MNTFVRFFYEFVSVFFTGLETIFKGIIGGFGKMFNFLDYKKLIINYKTKTILFSNCEK